MQRFSRPDGRRTKLPERRLNHAGHPCTEAPHSAHSGCTSAHNNGGRHENADCRLSPRINSPSNDIEVVLPAYKPRHSKGDWRFQAKARKAISQMTVINRHFPDSPFLLPTCRKTGGTFQTTLFKTQNPSRAHYLSGSVHGTSRILWKRRCVISSLVKREMTACIADFFFSPS